MLFLSEVAENTTANDFAERGKPQQGFAGL